MHAASSSSVALDMLLGAGQDHVYLRIPSSGYCRISSRAHERS
jgi:hypothetical protein